MVELPSALIFTARKALSAPLAGTPTLPEPTITSDTFTVARTDIAGTPTNAGLGGAPLTYQATAAPANSFAVSGGFLTRGSAGPTVTAYYSLDAGTPDAEIGVRITPEATGMLIINGRRTGTDAYRLVYAKSNNTLGLEVRTSAGTVSLGASIPIPAGQFTLALRATGSTIQAVVDGVVRISATNTLLPTGNRFGLSTFDQPLPKIDQLWLQET